MHILREVVLFFDSHCHLDSSRFDLDRTAVFRRSRDAKITTWLIPGVDFEGWPKIEELTSRQPGCFWAAGIHPLVVHRYSELEWQQILVRLEHIIQNSSEVRGVGEVGLHKVSDKGRFETQVVRLTQQLSIACKFAVPVVFHVVKAHDHLIDQLEAHAKPPKGGAIHGYTGSAQLAKRYLQFDLHFGVNGRWLHGGANRLKAAVKEIPLSRLLLESDAPDQCASVGQRNEPTSIIDAARFIAEQKQLTTDYVLRQCTKNAHGLFNPNG